MLRELIIEIFVLSIVNLIVMILPLVIYGNKIDLEPLLIQSITYACALTISKFVVDLFIGKGNEPRTIIQILFVPLSTTIFIYISNLILKKEVFDFKKVLVMFIENLSKYIYMDLMFITDTDMLLI